MDLLKGKTLVCPKCKVKSLVSRYRHKKQMEISVFKDNEKLANNSSIGSQREHISADFDPAKLEFINGIWGK